MVSPSTWKLSWRTTSESAFRVTSSYYHTPSTFSFSIQKRIRRKTNYPYLSLDKSSSGSSTPSSPHLGHSINSEFLPPHSFKSSKKKSVQIGGSDEDGDFLFSVDERNQQSLKPLISGEKVKSERSSIRKSGTSFNSLFGKKSMWRRILFASTKVRSIILLNILTVIFASEIPVLKEVEAVMDPAAFTVVRFATSAIPFLPFVLQARGDDQTRTAGIELGIWVSLGYLMQALGLLTSDAGRASFISLFTIIVVPLLDGMFGATVPPHTWFGALMSVIGVTMLEQSGSPPSVGDLLNFFSAVFFGVHMLRTEHISRITKRKNFLALLGYEVCVIALFSMIWYLMGGWFSGMLGWNSVSWTWTMLWDWIIEFPWIPALYTGIFSTGLCLWVEMTAMRDVSATETAIIYGLEPLWGAGFAWFLLGERWGTIGWIGAALVLGGSLTVQIYGASSPDRAEEDRELHRKNDHFLVSDKENGLSTSPIVESPENNPDMLKK